MEAAVESPAPAARLNGIDLVRLSQGVSHLFWGLPIASFFCIQLMILQHVVADPVVRSALRQLYFLLFVILLGVAFFGALKLTRVPSVGARWLRRARACLVVTALNVYFSPFVFWWQRVPENAFYTLNLFAFLGSVIVLLFALNLLCLEFGRYLGESSLVIESRLFMGINVLVLAVPALIGFAWAAWLSRHADSTQNLGLEFLQILDLPYPWRLTLYIVLFLPVSLTLANLWRVKEILVDEIKKLSKE